MDFYSSDQHICNAIHGTTKLWVPSRVDHQFLHNFLCFDPLLGPQECGHLVKKEMICSFIISDLISIPEDKDGG